LSFSYNVEVPVEALKLKTEVATSLIGVLSWVLWVDVAKIGNGRD
jgi:hypothetical protein